MKNKKLLLIALLSVCVFSGAFAQLQFSTNTVAGTISKNSVYLDPDTLTLNFDITSGTRPISTWRPCTLPANAGKDSIFIQKATTNRGVQAKAYLNKSTTTNYNSLNFKCDNAGNGSNPIHVGSMASLFDLMTRSIKTTTLGGSYVASSTGIQDSLMRPAACIFDKTGSTTDQAFGMYPGRAKRIEYLYRLNFSGKTCLNDVTFDIDTYDAGTTGKTATYSLEVYTGSTYSSSNLLGDTIVNFYTTGSGIKHVSLASELGISYNLFTNQQLYVVIKTLGTSNSSDVIDGIANTVTAGIPDVYDPTIIFDNFYLSYSAPYFTVPTNTNTNTVYVNYNNGTPAVKAADTALGNPGTAIPVTTNVSTPVTFNLRSFSRVGTFTVKENLGHSTVMTVDAATAFKANDGAGNYNVPVAAVRTDDATTLLWTLTVAAPTSGAINDDMTFTFNVNPTADGSSSFRLETSNGSARFYYDFAITASTPTDVNGVIKNPIGISSQNSSIYVINATENVTITNVAGQRVKTASASEAASGIQLASGIYLVKTGSTVQKVVVK